MRFASALSREPDPDRAIGLVADALQDRLGGALRAGCGRGLDGIPDHDSRVFEDALGPVPLGGFFANGEIGPVESQNLVHGYTSAFGRFRPRERV